MGSGKIVHEGMSDYLYAGGERVMLKKYDITRGHTEAEDYDGNIYILEN